MVQFYIVHLKIELDCYSNYIFEQHQQQIACVITFVIKIQVKVLMETN